MFFLSSLPYLTRVASCHCASSLKGRLQSTKFQNISQKRKQMQFVHLLCQSFHSGASPYSIIFGHYHLCELPSFFVFYCCFYWNNFCLEQTGLLCFQCLPHKRKKVSEKIVCSETNFYSSFRCYLDFSYFLRFLAEKFYLFM